MKHGGAGVGVHSTDLAPDDMSPALPARARQALVLGPLVGFGLILLTTGLLAGWGAVGFLAGAAAGTFVGGGKLVILAGAVDRAPVGHWALAALVVYIDLATALIVLGGIHHLYRLPGVGRRIASGRDAGTRLFQRHPWMHRITWVSLAGFVAVPLNGTGALVGSVIGRLLGLSRWSVVVATGCGSLAASAALALAGEYWAERINALASRPLLGIVAVFVVIALTVVGSRWARAGPVLAPIRGERVGPLSRNVGSSAC